MLSFGTGLICDWTNGNPRESLNHFLILACDNGCGRGDETGPIVHQFTLLLIVAQLLNLLTLDWIGSPA
jgi:hypothetical protein